MMDFLDKARRYLWAFVEVGFLAVLSIILVHLLMGQGSGPWVTSVVLALLYLIIKRLK